MKKSTKHIQFLRISLLIFALSFIFACSLGTQSYGKLSLSIEIPEYLKTEPNEQPSNARFIHPNGDRLEFELYTESRVIHTQTITLNPQPNNPNPQTVSISVDKVPYNVPLFAKITVYGKNDANDEEVRLGFNDIYIGYLKSGNNKLTLGVKPVSGANVAYEDLGQGLDQVINLVGPFGTYPDTSADTFNIEMFPKKGLYTFSVYDSEYIYLYDSDGKKYPNSFIIGNLYSRIRVFYHPEDNASTYYAYLGVNQQQSFNGVGVSGEKLEQDILITKKDGRSIEILYGYEENLGTVYSADEINSLALTIYNPYPFTLDLAYTIDNADGDHVEPESNDKFTFTGFPDVLLPGKSKEFTVIFQGSYPIDDTYCTISANGLKDFVLHFTGSTS